MTGSGLTRRIFALDDSAIPSSGFGTFVGARSGIWQMFCGAASASRLSERLVLVTLKDCSRWESLRSSPARALECVRSVVTARAFSVSSDLSKASKRFKPSVIILLCRTSIVETDVVGGSALYADGVLVCGAKTGVVTVETGAF